MHSVKEQLHEHDTPNEMHVLSKMVRYVLLRPLRPELNGQDPFQICEACVKLEKRRL
jgi:hypothetical protein